MSEKTNSETYKVSGKQGHKYNTSRIAYMHIAALPSCVSSLLSTFRLFQAFLGCAECFFCYAKLFLSCAEPFTALPSIFLPCWSLISFAKHFSSVLSTSQLFRAFFGHAKALLGSSNHLPSMLRGVSALPRIFQLCWSFFFLLCQADFGYAEPFSALPSVFILCYVVFLLCRVLFCSAVYCTA